MASFGSFAEKILKNCPHIIRNCVIIFLVTTRDYYKNFNFYVSNILIRYSLSPRVQDLPDSVKHTLREKKKFSSCLLNPDSGHVELAQMWDPLI